MAGDINPETVWKHLEKEKLEPFYLFYGPSEFRLERFLNRVRETCLPAEARDFNLHVFYAAKAKSGGETGVADILDTARSLPFMSSRRLIIVRRTEDFSANDLEFFLPYLDDPVETTCLIFVSSLSKPDFRTKFYNKIRLSGRSVHFKSLYDNQVVPWIKKTAKAIGCEIETEACEYLRQIAGNRLMDLYSEIEKLYLRHGGRTIGTKDVVELAIHSRIYTIFELTDKVSEKRAAESMVALKRFMEEEDKNAALKLLGMLSRQMRLLWQTRSIMKAGGRSSDVAGKLRVPHFVAQKLVKSSKKWSGHDLERALDLIFATDGLLKSDAYGQVVLENLVLSLCL